VKIFRGCRTRRVFPGRVRIAAAVDGSLTNKPDNTNNTAR
jgi:hypothetical protein